MPQGALDVSLIGAQRLEPLLPDADPAHFSVYGGLLQCAAIASTRVGDPWRGRELLRGKASRAAELVGDGRNHHSIFFGPTNVGIHAVALEIEEGDVMEALRLADQVDISKIESLERQCAHLYHLSRAYELRGNDAAVLIHLQMARQRRWQDFYYKTDVRNMVRTLLRRAKPSYLSEVRTFAGGIGLLD